MSLEHLGVLSSKKLLKNFNDGSMARAQGAKLRVSNG